MKRKSRPGRRSCRRLHEARPHQLDAVAHRRELGFPQRARARAWPAPWRRSARRGSAGSSSCARMTRLSCDSTRAASSLVGADDGQRADAFAVEREALRERARDEERPGCRGEPAHDARHLRRCRRRSPGRPCRGRARAPRAAHRVDDLLPLLGRQVDAGRVVAAGVQDDDRSGGDVQQRGQHRVEVEAAGRRRRSTGRS